MMYKHICFLRLLIFLFFLYFIPLYHMSSYNFLISYLFKFSIFFHSFIFVFSLRLEEHILFVCEVAYVINKRKKNKKNIFLSHAGFKCKN